MNSIEAAIQDVDARIVKLQSLKDSLAACLPIMFPNGNGHEPAAKAAPGKKLLAPSPVLGKRKYVRRNLGNTIARAAKESRTAIGEHIARAIKNRSPRTAPVVQRPAGSSVLSDKPQTLGGAMKYLIPRLEQPFSQNALIAAIEADPDFAAILAKSSPTSIYANLAYWSQSSNKLKRDDDGAYTILELEFFKPSE